MIMAAAAQTAKPAQSGKKATQQQAGQSSSGGSFDSDDDEDISAYFVNSVGRGGQRRNTDFSQADNDLRRFLAQREQQKREDSEQDLTALNYR